MAAILDEIETWLTAQGVVDGSTGWTLKKGFIPPSPDQIVSLFETPGPAADITKAPSIEAPYDELNFQVRIRGIKFQYQQTRAQLQLIFLALHQNEPPKVAGENYVYIYATTSSPLPLGKDSSDRDELSWNFRALRQRQ